MATMATSSTTASVVEIADFYDEFNARLLRDYVIGNPRVDAAVQRVISVITPNTRNVLDVGCGIGTSSAEYLQRAPWIEVVGVDISPANINTASKLFTNSKLRFCVSDMSEAPADAPFDLIAMLDVYEHVPREHWPTFNQVIARSLGECGVVVMTTPSPLHQEYLRAHKPDGLQIVDETVELKDIVQLAADIGATITLYEWVNVWRTNQYVHVVLERQPQLTPVKRKTGRRKRQTLAQRIRGMFQRRPMQGLQNERRQQVRDRLGVTISDGLSS